MRKDELIPILFLLFIVCQCFGQDTDRKIFGNAYVSSERGEWVLGEIVIGDFSRESGTLYNGFLHSSQVVTSSSDKYHPDFSIIIYPNPTSAIIHLNHDSASPVYLHIYDALGRLQRLKKNLHFEEDIDIGWLPPGIYIFRYGSAKGWGKQLIHKI